VCEKCSRGPVLYKGATHTQAHAHAHAIVISSNQRTADPFKRKETIVSLESLLQIKIKRTGQIKENLNQIFSRYNRVAESGSGFVFVEIKLA
jgi:hypothetical protein